MLTLNENQITPEIVEKIKKAHPGKRIFKWSQLGIIYTPITRQLHEKILEMTTKSIESAGRVPFNEVEEMVVKECVLFPTFTDEDRKELPIGTYATLNKLIHEKSNFLDVDVLGRPLCRDVFSDPIVDFEYWDDINEKETEVLKKEHPYALYKIFVGEYPFVSRQLSRKDVESTDKASDIIFERVKKVVVWPKQIDWDLIPAGVVDQIYDEIKNLSGYMESKVTIEEL